MTRLSALCRTAATLCLLAGGAAAQQSVSLSADEMRGFASQLLNNGDAPRALAVTEALLTRNPDDVGALVLRAQAAIAIAEFDLAIEAASAAYSAATRQNAKFTSARLAALAYAEMDRDTLAQIWLRRARQFAPSEEQAADVAEDYRFLRRRNPWSTRLQFGVSPTNNVNNGSSAETVFLNGGFVATDASLNNEARALSGLAITAGVSTKYRLSETRDSITHALASLNGVTYALSQDAKEGIAEDRVNENLQAEQDCIDTAAGRIAYGQALIKSGEEDIAAGRAEDPDNAELIQLGEAKITNGLAFIAAGENPGPCVLDESPLSTGADYAFANLSFGLSHRRILSEGAQPTDFAVQFSQSWYGGDLYAKSVNVSASHDWRWDEDSFVGGTIFAEYREFDQDRPGVSRLGISGQYRTRLDNNDQLALRSGLQKSFTEVPTDSASSNYHSLSLGVDYDLARPIAGMNFGLSASAKRNFDHPFQVVYLANRVDTSATLRVDAQLNDLEYYGFRPVISLEGRAVESNIDVFDQRTISLGFDLRSSF